MRLYIAGSSSERPLIATLIYLVQKAGYEVTFDWTRHSSFDVPPPGPSEEVLLEAARLDFEAVKVADVLWYVAPADKSEGSATELGMALAFGKRVVVSGQLGHARIFPRLGTKVFTKHEEALAFLKAFKQASTSRCQSCGATLAYLGLTLCDECAAP
jgi:hypothetical protein